MAQKGGPDIPISGIQLLLDARNPITLNASGWNSLVNSFTGTATGATTSGTGTTFGLTFTSSTDKIDFSDISKLNLTANITIAAWIYPNSYGGGSSGRIYDKYKSTFPQSGYALYIDNNVGSNAIAYSSGYTVSAVTARLNSQITLSTWQHVAAVHSGTTVTFYINGASIGSSSSIIAPSSASGISAVVGNNSAGTNNFDGKISSVRVYSSALSANEIRKLYDATRSKFGL